MATNQPIIAALKELQNCFSVTFKQDTEIPEITTVPSTTTGTVASGYRGVSIYNVGDSDILVKGEVVPSGVTVEWSASMNNVVGAISYDSQNSEIIITTLK